VELAPDAQVLGMELYEGMIRVGALSLRGDASEVVEHPLRSHDRSAVVGEILESIRPLMRRRHVHGLGVALAGIVDSRRGISRRIAHFEGWRDVPLSRELESAVGVPVRLGNLTEVRLVDLKSRGVIGPGMTAALVVLEPGAIGCGIVAEGQLLRGAVESSSELGQTIVQMGDQQLRLEELTEWPRLRDQVTRRGGEAPASAMAFFRSGDAVAAEVRLALTRHLGIALANLVFLIKPARLLLTGSLTEHRETFIDPLCAGLRSHLLPSFDEALTIEVLPQTPGEGVRCAASLALERLFAVPEVRSV
jgi:glucokinase